MWSLKTIEADATEVASAVRDAVDTYKAETTDTVAHRAVDAAAKFVSDLVDSGVFGTGRVSATVSGHANAEPTGAGDVAPDQVSIHVRAVPVAPGDPPPQEAQEPATGDSPAGDQEAEAAEAGTSAAPASRGRGRKEG